jgi:transposase
MKQAHADTVCIDCSRSLDLIVLSVSPAMIPRRAGDRIKTDRRDAEMLARLWRAGELTPVWTPDEEQEAMRDLIRTRKQSLDALKIAKQQLQSFLLRHGLRYNRPT